LRVGGQALPDGVFMRTDRAWAIARADGTIEVGETRHNPFGRIPVLRVVFGLVSALALSFSRGLVRRGNGGRGPTRRRDAAARRRFLVAFLAVLVFGSFAPALVGGEGGHSLLWITMFHAVGLAGTLAVLRVTSPPAVWRYHGAEHKAVAAHELGVDLRDNDAVLACPRVHDRCGTNLAVPMTILGIAVTALPGAIQIPLFLGVLGSTAELVSLAAAKPRSAISRVLLTGGRFLQARITTAEPTAAEQAVGCRALLAALAEHDRLVAADGAGLAAAA
jgi:uncharacterized protein YqhQ